MLGIGSAIAITISAVLTATIAVFDQGPGIDVPCDKCLIENLTASCVGGMQTSSEGSCGTCDCYKVRVTTGFCGEGQCNEVAGDCVQVSPCVTLLIVEYASDDCEIRVTVRGTGGTSCCALNCESYTSSESDDCGDWEYPTMPNPLPPPLLITTNTDCGDSCEITIAAVPTTGSCTPVSIVWGYDCTACP